MGFTRPTPDLLSAGEIHSTQQCTQISLVIGCVSCKNSDEDGRFPGDESGSFKFKTI